MAPSATRKAPQDRKAPAPKSLKSAIDQAPQMVEIITTDQPEVEYIPLFSIDEEVYRIPSEVSASMALRVLDMARKQGMEAAMSGALEELLGEESYRALLSCKSLTTEHLEGIMAAVQFHVLGKLESTTGN